MKFFDKEFEDIAASQHNDNSRNQENSIHASRASKQNYSNLMRELNNSNLTFGGLNGTRNGNEDEDDNFKRVRSKENIIEEDDEVLMHETSNNTNSGNEETKGNGTKSTFEKEPNRVDSP
jgi:hypothetical protein|tara:strand:+ start:208 stop:567 length:360 start_codon:yes stop_codon:yes gene_type:complete